MSAIVTFPRSDTERLSVSFDEYEGSHFVSARIQFKGPDGQWHPTKKGVTIKLRELFEFHDAIGKACEMAKQVRR
jgi:hypothetical protein